MNRTDRERLEDARDHLSIALTAYRSVEFDDLWSDRTRRHALIFDLIVVSDTLTKLSPEAKAQSSRIPWRMITDTRNRLIHVYWRQDRAFFEQVLEVGAPDLLNAIQELIERLDHPP